MAEINNVQPFFNYNFKDQIKAVKHGLLELFLVAKRAVEGMALTFTTRE